MVVQTGASDAFERLHAHCERSQQGVRSVYRNEHNRKGRKKIPLKSLASDEDEDANHDDEVTMMK